MIIGDAPSHAPAPGVPDLPTALRRAVGRIDGRFWTAMVAIALASSAWTAFALAFGAGPRTPQPEALLSGIITNFVIVPCVMYATLVADELTSQTGRPSWLYLGAVVSGTALGVLTHAVVHRVLGVSVLPANGVLSGPPTALQAAALFFEYLIWGSLLVFLYVHRQRANLAAARLDAARLDRALRQRQMVEARLQALQARVEPQFLIGTLTRVRDLYETDVHRAGTVFDQLIAYLRAALPNLRSSMSTVRQELDLVTAYLGVVAGEPCQTLECHVDVEPGTDHAGLPAMVLLPLVSSLLADGGDDRSMRPLCFEIRVRRRDDQVRMDIHSYGIACERFVPGVAASDVDQRLQEIYGDDYHLSIDTTAGVGIRIVLEIPDDRADRSHR